MVLTPGQAGDCPVAEQLLGWLRRDTIVLADTAYDADWLRRRIEAAGAAPNSPPWYIAAGDPAARCSPARKKDFRRLATRYEKHPTNFLAMLKLAATHPMAAP